MTVLVASRTDIYAGRHQHTLTLNTFAANAASQKLLCLAGQAITQTAARNILAFTLLTFGLVVICSCTEFPLSVHGSRIRI